MSNRVQHQKLNQVTAELPPGWVFGVQLGLRQTQALINTYHIILIQHHSSSIDSLETDPTCGKLDHFPESGEWHMMMNECDVIGINQCLCLPKAELNTKNSTRWQRVFGVQLDYSCRLKSVSSTAEKCVFVNWICRRVCWTPKIYLNGYRKLDRSARFTWKKRDPA